MSKLTALENKWKLKALDSYLPNLDDLRTSRNAKIIHQALFHEHEYGRVAGAIAERVKGLIIHKGFELEAKRTKTFDVVKDVLNLGPIHWMAEEIVWCFQMIWTRPQLTLGLTGSTIEDRRVSPRGDIRTTSRPRI